MADTTADPTTAPVIDGSTIDGGTIDGVTIDGVAIDPAPAASSSGRRDVLPAGWAADPWFSLAIELDRPARWVVTGAIGPLAEDGTVLHDLDPTAQVALTMANLERVLAATGMDLSHVVRVTVATIDLPAVADQLALVAERLVATGARPALCLHGVTQLPHAGALLALDVVAVA